MDEMMSGTGFKIKTEGEGGVDETVGHKVLIVKADLWVHGGSFTQFCLVLYIFKTSHVTNKVLGNEHKKAEKICN